MMKRNRKIIILTILALILLSGTSYALWQLTLTQTNKNAITTGCFKIDFKEENDIELLDALPITNDDAKKLVPYEFSLTNTCNSYAGYQVNLEILNDSTLKRLEYINVMLNENKPKSLTENDVVNITLDNASTSYKLESGVLDKKEEKVFELRLWLSDATPLSEEVMNKTLSSKITVIVNNNATYTEAILNGADPVLKDELVPVTIKSNGDVEKASIKEKWYSYKEKMWANAVILKDESIKYNDGEPIPEDNIESYFVWVPRYRYKIFNDEKYDGLTEFDTTKVQIIEVEFENKFTTPSTGTKKDEWLTHPAFTSFDTNGMWVGKFETSKSNENEDDSVNPEGVQIKPNVASWRNIQVAKAFYTTYDYKRNLDSHMMKNSEWGAVAYLQHSKYGSASRIRFNNNSNYLTGYASVNEPTCGYTGGSSTTCNQFGTSSTTTLSYNTETGYLASTTGNITGIYDMAGGAWEHVMGVMLTQNGIPIYHSSGFAKDDSEIDKYSMPSDKYYDKYDYGLSYNDFTRGHLGDATTEVGPYKSIIYANDVKRQIGSWYDNAAQFVNVTYPWFYRGSIYLHGVEAGVFAFYSGTGSSSPSMSFRTVLTP